MSKLRSLTTKEVIMAMVEGLENPKTKIDMFTYGEVMGGVCYGCAATNAICRIFDIDKPEEYFVPCNGGFENTPLTKIEKRDDISNFELAVDSLRMGYLDKCNFNLKRLGIVPIVNPNNIKLPQLGDYYTQGQLAIYRQLANDQI
jgi:hypothetical protein